MKKTFFTHWDGGAPFLVRIDGDTVSVFKDTDKIEKWWGPNSDTEDPDKKDYVRLVKTFKKVIKIFIPTGKYSKSEGPGSRRANSILLQLPTSSTTGFRYAFIGYQVYEFNTSEPITKFYATMGPSSVPYPVALSKTQAYFMLDHTLVPKALFPKGTQWYDAYSEYYEYFDYGDVPKKFQKLKIVHKPIH